jgi:hypothetical protein
VFEFKLVLQGIKEALCVSHSLRKKMAMRVKVEKTISIAVVCESSNEGTG